MSLLAILFSVTVHAEWQPSSSYLQFPTGEKIYCADKGALGAVENQMSLWRQRNPKCEPRVTSYAEANGGLRIEIWNPATGCYAANIHIQPGAGCAM